MTQFLQHAHLFTSQVFYYHYYYLLNTLISKAILVAHCPKVQCQV
uniref:Uncharacterized protein n=1 Tax=Anguilla anguilla TaxID=7936 RepID=A0A0E9WC40_ANGAN